MRTYASNRSLAFNDRINECDNEYDREAFERAYDAMKALLESTSSGCRKAVVQGMWTAFGTEHRTNQQSGIRSLVEMLRIFGGCEKARACDARNEAAYEFAKKVAEDDTLGFPYI